MTDWIRRIEIDPDWYDYEIEVTPGWIKRVDASMSKRNRLTPVLFDLATDLGGATMAASLPFVLTSNIVHYHKGHLEGKQNKSYTHRVADAITLKLASKLRGSLKLSPQDLIEIQGACREIQRDLELAYEVAVPVSHQYVWQRFREETRIQRMAWHGQQLCFVAAYSALENFLVQSVAVALKQPSFKKKRADEFPELRDLFGEEIHDMAWADPYPVSVRLARNAILHNGGRETDTLSSHGHDILVRDQILQFKAHNNIRLLRHIEACAEKVIEIGSQMPAVLREKKKKRRRGRKR
jgi:hypothetical protein